MIKKSEGVKVREEKEREKTIKKSEGVKVREEKTHRMDSPLFPFFSQPRFALTHGNDCRVHLLGQSPLLSTS